MEAGVGGGGGGGGGVCVCDKIATGAGTARVHYVRVSWSSYCFVCRLREPLPLQLVACTAISDLPVTD